MNKMVNNIKLKYYNFYKNNLEEIYKNLNTIFKINIKEFEEVMVNSTNGLSNSFFEESLKDIDLKQCYEQESLQNLVSSFKSVNINEEQIKQIILKYPEIITFSNMTNNIQYLFKAHDLKAILLIFNEKYNYYIIDSYLLKNYNYYIDNNLKHNIYINDMDTYYENVNKQTYKNSPVDYFNELLKILDREDIKKYYNLNDDSTLLQKVNVLSADFNKREFYIKNKTIK